MKKPKLKDLFTKVGRLRKFIPTILLTSAMTTALCTSSTATLVTQEWQNSHRGYSVELIPGTGGQSGIPAEYVAAGTVYDQGQPTPAWHFMHLDNMGNVISERTSWAMPGTDHEFRVVDIVCQSPTEFWITIQARDKSPGNEKDYIYLAGIDIAGNDLPMNPAIAIISNNATHNNLYPTHSYFASNGYLYLCGYAGDNTQFPNEPDRYYSDKYGMFMRVDVNTMGTTYYFWDGGYFNGKDYDMALKIAPYDFGQEFPLLVTGAGSTGDEWLSGAFVGKFQANTTPVTMNCVTPVSHMISHITPRPHGVYGVDIRGGVYGGDNGYVTDPDVVVLINDFDSFTWQNNKYGITRIKNNLTTYPFPIQSYKLIGGNDGNSWAKQFLELHNYRYGGTTNITDNHVYIVGETAGFEIAGSVPAGARFPSLSSINAFTKLTKFGTGFWDYGTGFTSTSVAMAQLVYLSSVGTQSMNMDYYVGSLGIGAAREDITRLYTFSSLERYYDDPNIVNPPSHFPGMVLPIADEANMEPELKTKFLETSAPSYEETTCRKNIYDPNIIRTDQMDGWATFSSQYYTELTAVDGYTVFSLLDIYNMIPPLTDCTTGYYKPTGIASVQDDKTITLYPNPTITELNIKLPEHTDYTVTLTDMAGKVVYNQSGNGAQAKLNLPQLSAGTYLATISTTDVIHSEQLVIQ